MDKGKRIEASHLKSHIGYRMRVVSNAVSHAFARKLATDKVTVAEWVILREMYSSNERTSPSIVAEFTGLTRGAVSKLIDRLIAKDLVTRTESTNDRRYQEIGLTAKATRLVPKLASIADENDEAFFSVLTSRERKILMSIFVKLSQIHNLNNNPIE